jgi:tetratricopeptide (TPR) repeat protein
MSHGDVDGLCLAGRYHRKLGHLRTATEIFQNVLAQQPGTVNAEEGLGGVFLDQGQTQPALIHLEAASRLAPESPSVQNLMGVAHGRLGHFDRAVLWFRRASDRLPNDSAIHRNLALAEEQLDHPREAIAQFREVLRLNPDDAQARSAINRLAARNLTQSSRRTAH